MLSKRPSVIVTRKLPDTVETRMRELFDVRLNASDTALTQAELKAAVAEAEVLVPTVTDRIDAEVLRAAGPKLKLVAQFGAGIDNIDIAAAHRAGLIVTNTPGVLTEDTADLTMALILAVPRRLVEGERVVREGKWGGWSPTFMMGHRISGKRLGIIGMGRIGQAVALRARAFGMQIHYHNRNPVNPEIEAELDATFWSDLDKMLAQSDVISINCPRTPATHHLLNADRLARLQPHTYIVNTSRGDVIDEEALAKALMANAIAGAGLDVFEQEPRVNPKLIGLPNVVLLPHLGSATVEGRTAMGERVIINIRTMADGHRAPDRVLPQLS